MVESYEKVKKKINVRKNSRRGATSTSVERSTNANNQENEEAIQEDFMIEEGPRKIGRKRKIEEFGNETEIMEMKPNEKQAKLTKDSKLNPFDDKNSSELFMKMIKNNKNYIIVSFMKFIMNLTHRNLI